MWRRKVRLLLAALSAGFMEIGLAAALNADCAAVVNISTLQQAKVEKAVVKHPHFRSSNIWLPANMTSVI